MISANLYRELAHLFLIESDSNIDDSERLARISLELHDRADEAEESECAA